MDRLTFGFPSLSLGVVHVVHGPQQTSQTEGIPGIVEGGCVYSSTATVYCLVNPPPKMVCLPSQVITLKCIVQDGHPDDTMSVEDVHFELQSYLGYQFEGITTSRGSSRILMHWLKTSTIDDPFFSFADYLCAHEDAKRFKFQPLEGLLLKRITILNRDQRFMKHELLQENLNTV